MADIKINKKSQLQPLEIVDITGLQTALDAKEVLANKSASITTDTGSTVKYPTVAAVETYVSALTTDLDERVDDLEAAVDSLETVVGDSTSGLVKAVVDNANAIAELDADKLDKNTAITGATKTKITYDANGLVTAGADAAISDIVGLQTALNDKVTKNADITGGTFAKVTVDAKGLVTAGAALDATDIPEIAISKVTGLQTALDALDTDIETNADAIAALDTDLDALTVRVGTAESDIDALETGVSALTVRVEANEEDIADLQADKLDKAFSASLVQSSAWAQTTTAITNTVTSKATADGTVTPITTTIQTASATQIGLMPAASFVQIEDNTAAIEALQGTVKNFIATGLPAPAVIEATDLEAVITAQASRAPAGGDTIDDKDNGVSYRYYADNTDGIDGSGWHQVTSTVSLATNTAPGIVQGSTADGKAFAENDGTLSVNGWDDVKDAISDNADAILTKQAKLSGTEGQAILFGNAEGIVTGRAIVAAPASASTSLITAGGVFTALENKVEKNTAITAATKTKITYDAKGLVTAGADATVADIDGLEDALDEKQNVLTPTAPVSIENDVISVATMVGATASTAGAAGLVPAGSAGAANRFLSVDGTFKIVTQPQRYEMDLSGDLDGEALEFDLTEDVGADHDVYYNGQHLRNSKNYTITASKLTLTISEAPLSGEDLLIIYRK